MTELQAYDKLELHEMSGDHHSSLPAIFAAFRAAAIGTCLAVCVSGCSVGEHPDNRGIVVLRLCVFVLVVVGAACGAEVRGEDRWVCSEDADCASSCETFARVEAAELQTAMCVGTRCSCGLENDDGCLATGGVIGREEVSCPADDVVVRAAADAAMTITPGDNDA